MQRRQVHHDRVVMTFDLLMRVPLGGMFGLFVLVCLRQFDEVYRGLSLLAGCQCVFVRQQVLFAQANRRGVRLQHDCLLLQNLFNLRKLRRRLPQFVLPSGQVTPPLVVVTFPLPMVLVHRCMR